MNGPPNAIHAFKWSALAEVASRVAGAVVFLVMARLLVPEDFGVLAAATVVISLSQVFAEAGLDKALIQRQRDVDASANIVFWVNLSIGAVVVLALIVAAPWIATFFHDARIGPVVRILSLQILLSSLGLVHTALLRKELEFRRLFIVRLLTTTAGALASIPLAMMGMGYWALVAGVILGQAAQTAVLWIQSRWRPSLHWDRAVAPELLRFGAWAMLSGMLLWFYAWMDAVIVGRYLGAHDLGLYRTGNTLASMVFGMVLHPLLPVLYSLFSRAQDDLARLRGAFRTVTHAIAVASLPIAAFLFAFSEPLARLLFGPNWAGVGRVIAILGLTHGIGGLVGANGEMYRAIGKPHAETWTTTAVLLIYLGGYLVSAQHGLDAFLKTRLALAAIGVLAHIIVARIALGVPFAQWIQAGVIATAVAAAGAVLYLQTMFAGTLPNLVLMATVFLIVCAAGLAAFERRFLRQLIGTMKAGVRW